MIYWDGAFVEESEATLPLSDPAALYGEGVFTTLRVVNGRIAFLEEHWQRLKEGCQWLGVEADLSMEPLFELIPDEGVWRAKVAVTGGGRVMMRVDPAAQRSREPVSLHLYPYPIEGQIYRYKTFSQLERRRMGGAVSTTESGLLLEATYANLFWAYGGRLYTPDWERLPVLKGVYLSALGPLERVICTLDDVPQEANLFLCNAIRGVVPVCAVGDRTFPVGGDEIIAEAEAVELLRSASSLPLA